MISHTKRRTIRTEQDPILMLHKKLLRTVRNSSQLRQPGRNIYIHIRIFFQLPAYPFQILRVTSDMSDHKRRFRMTAYRMGYHKIYYRFFETKDEYFPYQPEGELPGQGRWAIYGIGLEDEILKKIYYKNACKVLSLDENRFVGGVR